MTNKRGRKGKRVEWWNAVVTIQWADDKKEKLKDFPSDVIEAIDNWLDRMEKGEPYEVS